MSKATSDGSVVDVLRLALVRLPTLLGEYAAAGVVALRERQLQLATQTALNALPGASSLRAIRERARRLEGWPRNGPVDIILTDDGTDAALVELKWGTELWNCVWDVGKMALANADLGLPTFLLAGASRATWAARKQGTSYFDDGHWTARELIAGNRALFAIPDWGFPTRLPEHFTTASIARIELTVAGDPWQLRLARVRATGSVIELPAE